MKNTLIYITMALTLSLATGCLPKVVQTPAPGAVDTTDSIANQTLQTLYAFQAKVSTDVQSGAVALTPAQRSALDTANKALNTAVLAEQAYHNAGGGDASILNAAVTAAQSAFTTVQGSLASTIVSTAK
jgi:hypothetical protein